MNGSKFAQCFLVLFIMLSSCVNRFVLEHEGEALFLLYRGVPRRDQGKLFIWENPKYYIESEKSYMSQATQQLLAAFEENYLVLRIGNLGTSYTIDRITYGNIGERLNIQLLEINEHQILPSDIGYPIFVQQKNIKQIALYSNDVQIFLTNLQKKSLP